jgi:hypothetical protein
MNISNHSNFNNSNANISQSLSLSATKTNNYQHHITNADHPIKPKTSFKAHPLKTFKKKTNEK